MAQKEDSRKEVREGQLTWIERFFDQNKRNLSIGVGAVVAVTLGIIGYQKMIAQPREVASQEAYWNAFYAYQNNDTSEIAYNGDERTEGLADIADEYTGTPGGDIANYAMATRSMEKKEWENALDYLDNCNFQDAILGTLVWGMKGDCHVELGDYETAAEQFEKAAEREENAYTSPLFLKKLGLVYEALGEDASAAEAYQSIKEKWSDADEARDIDKYIARIQP